MTEIQQWTSIITLIVFLLTSELLSTSPATGHLTSFFGYDIHADLVVVFPFSIPLYFPTTFWLATARPTLVKLRILPKPTDNRLTEDGRARKPIAIRFPFNFVTMPFISVIFLICLGAIGRTEVYDGTLGADKYVD